MAPKISEVAVAARLEKFFEGVGAHLKDRRKRESFAMYAMGILGDVERKSTEPIAARACPDPQQVNNVHSLRILKERWRTERMYQDLKGELGLDHFERRSFPGWQHHVSVVMCCYAFAVAERARAFPPSVTRNGQDDPIRVAA